MTENNHSELDWDLGNNCNNNAQLLLEVSQNSATTNCERSTYHDAHPFGGQLHHGFMAAIGEDDFCK